YVGGNFTTAGGVRANRIAYFNGTNFVALGDGVDGTVNAIAKLNNGDVIAGGSFLNASGVPATGIARWDGTTWSTYNGGVSPFSTVGALLVEPNGNLLVGGNYTSIGGVAINNIARFDGTNWTPVGNNAPPTAALARLANGTLVAAGGFTSPGQRVVQLNGASWGPVGNGANNSVTSLAARPDGTVVRGGFFTGVNNGVADIGANRIAIGTATGAVNTWTALGSGLTLVNQAFANTVLQLTDGTIFAGGGFSAAGGTPASSVALWNPTTSSWSAMGAGVNVNVLASAQLPSGDILIGGGFTTAGANVSAYLGRWTTPSPAFVTADPSDATVCATGEAVFTVGTSGGPVTFQWRKGGAPINSTTNPSAATASLSISNASLLDEGNYDCVVTSACGSVTSAAAHLTVCPGDFNCDGGVDGDDVIAFFGLWDAGDIAADVNGDSGVDGDDVIAFFERWDAGC
ncbi:MAG: GC-type dockerin domain-anchored protein, partial [Phycisphaerales bacterium]